MLQLLHLLGGRLSLCVGLACRDRNLRLFQRSDGFPIGGVRLHSGGKNHQVHIHLNLLTQHGVVGSDDESPVVSTRNVSHLPFGQEDPRVLLHSAIEVLVLPWSPNELVENVRFGLVVHLAQIHGLLE